jgi:hypothetical protein
VDEKRNKKHNPQCGVADVNADGCDCNRCNSCNISEGVKSVTGEGPVYVCSVRAQKT